MEDVITGCDSIPLGKWMNTVAIHISDTKSKKRTYKKYQLPIADITCNINSVVNFEYQFLEDATETWIRPHPPE